VVEAGLGGRDSVVVECMCMIPWKIHRGCVCTVWFMGSRPWCGYVVFMLLASDIQGTSFNGGNVNSAIPSWH
jgi:hypothetical protein